MIKKKLIKCNYYLGIFGKNMMKKKKMMNNLYKYKTNIKNIGIYYLKKIKNNLICKLIYIIYKKYDILSYILQFLPKLLFEII
jgi:membrane protein YqaA with SNARE-associated domain